MFSHFTREKNFCFRKWWGLPGGGRGAGVPPVPPPFLYGPASSPLVIYFQSHMHMFIKTLDLHVSTNNYATLSSVGRNALQSKFISYIHTFCYILHLLHKTLKFDLKFQTSSATLRDITTEEGYYVLESFCQNVDVVSWCLYMFIYVYRCLYMFIDKSICRAL